MFVAMCFNLSACRARVVQRFFEMQASCDQLNDQSMSAVVYSLTSRFSCY